MANARRSLHLGNSGPGRPSVSLFVVPSARLLPHRPGLPQPTPPPEYGESEPAGG
ncbi:hypothetical protein OG530_18640 [Streptomyces decoyicus]|uniref:hypothetical protein n=1 Tax=Streptomyces decoyicus TaxID=249567 RepID=UPI002E195896